MCEYWLGYGVYKENLLNILFSKSKEVLREVVEDTSCPNKSNSETQVLNEASFTSVCELRYRSTAGGSQSLMTIRTKLPKANQLI